MSVLNVVLYPDEPLTRKAEPFQEVGPEVAQLAADMIETMHAYDGVGLAGPQVGISKRIFVMQESPEADPICLVNPEILLMEGSVEGDEGCLSLPRIYSERVPRASRIEVKALDEMGTPLHFEAQDFAARIIQHEFDHLEGKFFFDRLDIISRGAVLQEWEAVRAEMAESADQPG